MRIFRYGRVLDSQTDVLFEQQFGNAVMLDRSNTDNYIRPRTPHVDCTTTPPIPSITSYDDGSQTNRWVPVAGKSLPDHISGQGWKFTQNRAIRTSYNIPNTITQYSARVLIPAPYFPIDVIPRQWCLTQVDNEDVIGQTISGLGIRWGNVFWGVGHYRVRCCPNQSVEESACLILDVGGNRQYFFPLWGNVAVVDLTIQRLSSTQVRVQATGGGNTFTHTFTHTLTWAHPYRAEYYLYQLSQGCTAPEPIGEYTLQRMYSPSLVYSLIIELPIEYRERDMFVMVKTMPDPLVSPFTDVVLEFEEEDEKVETILCEYNSETNLWEPEFLYNGEANRFWFAINTNQVLERVSLLIGGAELHYVPAEQQVEWLAVLTIEMEQTGIPPSIIPIGYNILGVPDYARWLDSGVLGILPADYVRVLTIHLREKSV